MADDQPPPDLSHAGAVVDKAIEYMNSQNISPMAIASALLGGAMARWRVACSGRSDRADPEQRDRQRPQWRIAWRRITPAQCRHRPRHG